MAVSGIAEQETLSRGCLYRQNVKIRVMFKLLKIPVSTHVREIICVVKVPLSNRDCNIYFKPTLKCRVLPASQKPRKG